MAKKNGLEVDDSGVPHWVTYGDSGDIISASPLGGITTSEGRLVRNEFLRAQTEGQNRIQPKGSGDVLLHPSNTNQMKTVGPAGRMIAAIPGEISDIAKLPTFPNLPGGPAPELGQMIKHFFVDSPGVIQSVKDAEMYPMRAASDIYQTGQGVKGAVNLARSLPELANIFRGAKGTVTDSLVNRAAGLSKPGDPFWIDALEQQGTTIQQTGQNLAKQGINLPLPVMGEPSQTVARAFAKNKTGATALKETEQKISEAIKSKGTIPAGIKEGDPEAIAPIIWQEIYKNSTTGESGILNANKLIDYIKANGKGIKDIIGGEQSVALQEFAHGLKRTQAIGDGAIEPTSWGFRIMQQIPATIAGGIGHAAGGTMGGVAAAGATKAASSIALNSKTFGKLLADKEGRWILARMAGKKATDPSLKADMMKLAGVAGKIGVAVNINTGSGSGNQEVNNDQ